MTHYGPHSQCVVPSPNCITNGFIYQVSDHIHFFTSFIISFPFTHPLFLHLFKLHELEIEQYLLGNSFSTWSYHYTNFGGSQESSNLTICCSNYNLWGPLSMFKKQNKKYLDLELTRTWNGRPNLLRIIPFLSLISIYVQRGCLFFSIVPWSVAYCITKLVLLSLDFYRGRWVTMEEIGATRWRWKMMPQARTMEEGWVWFRFWEMMWAEGNKRGEMGWGSSIMRVALLWVDTMLNQWVPHKGEYFELWEWKN